MRHSCPTKSQSTVPALIVVVVLLLLLGKLHGGRLRPQYSEGELKKKLDGISRH